MVLKIFANTVGGFLNELALFAGSGGGILGGKLLGWSTVCAVERDAYAASVLLSRQNDGLIPPFPIWDDVCTFDGRPWRGLVDVVSGGFPCQDISAAGRGEGIAGKKSGLWKEMARIIGEVRPQFVFVENSPMLICRGLETVLSDFAALGYDARWGIVGAHHVTAPHKRDRIWIVADANSVRESSKTNDWNDARNWISDSGKSLDDTNGSQCKRNKCAERIDAQHSNISGSSWWAVEPDVGRVAHGVANRMDRLKAIGNGQVPEVARIAWELLNN